MPSSSEQAGTRSNIGIVVFVLAMICFISARTHADPDLWGHVRFGQDILASGIPAADSYSYVTTDSPWINHELLAEVLFGAAFKELGAPGLVGLKVVLILVTVGLVFRRLLRQGMHALRAGIVVVAVLMLMSVGLWTIRPHLFTYLFFLLTLLLIDSAERGSRWSLWALPVVMFVWVNSHGGFLAGLGVVVIWAAAHVVHRLRESEMKNSESPGLATLAVVVFACAGATLVNPYGVKLLLFLLRTATVKRPEIGEWQPIMIASPEGIAYLAVVVWSAVSLLRSARPRRFALLAVLLATAVLPLLALRHLPLFGLAFAVFAGEHLGDVWNRWSPADRGAQGKWLGIAGIAGAAAFLIAAVPHVSCIRIDPSFVRYPARATAVMRQAGVQGNLATFFDWGEYIIWHLGPQVRVSIDGRRETVYSPESYNRSMRFLYGIGNWDDILEDHRTDMALVGRDQPTYNLMRLKPGWLLVYEDSLSALYARPESAQAAAIQRVVPPDLPPDGSGLCFP